MLKRLVFLCVLPLVLSTSAVAQNAPLPQAPPPQAQSPQPPASTAETKWLEDFISAKGGCGQIRVWFGQGLVNVRINVFRGDVNADMFGRPARGWTDDDIATAARIYRDCETKIRADFINNCVRGGHDQRACDRGNPDYSLTQAQMEDRLRDIIVTARKLDDQRKIQEAARIEAEKLQAQRTRARLEEEARSKQEQLREQAQRDKEATEEARRAAESEAPKIAEATKEAEEARRARQEAEQRLAEIRSRIEAQERAGKEALARSQAAEALAERSEGRLSEPDATGKPRTTAPARAAEADPRVYASAMANAVPTMARRMGEFGTSCGAMTRDPATWDRCASAIEIVLGGIRIVQNQMSALAVPDCFGNVDRMMRHALDLLDQGYSTTRNGILARSIAMTQTGMHEVENGNQELNKVTEVLKSSAETCTVARLHYLLSSLHDATGVDAEAIQQKAVQAHAELRDRYGKDVSVLEIMEGLYQMRATLSKLPGSKNLDGFLAMIVVLIAKN